MTPSRLLLTGLLLLGAACASAPEPRPDSALAATGAPDAGTPAPGPASDAGPPAAAEAAPPTSAPKPSAPAATGVRADFERAVEIARRGELAAAEAGLKTLLEDNPKLDYAWTNLGLVHERLGKTDEAERDYRKALTLKPDQESAWDYLVRMHCRAGRAASVEAELRQQLEARPDSLGLRTALAVALLCQKKHEPAATEAKRTLKQDERYVRAMQVLAQVYFREGKNELARMVLDNARAIDAQDAATHNALGLVQLAMGQRPAALESFKQAAQLRPDFAEARNNFGALLNDAQDYAAAAAELEAAVRSAPDFAQARLNLGNAYRGLGDFVRAKAEYEQVLKLQPGLTDTYFNLAILHLDAEPPEVDTLERLKTCLSWFEQYKAKGGRDERVAQYEKDAQKGLEKEERRRERERRDQLRKTEKAEAERKKAEEEAARKKAEEEAQKAAAPTPPGTSPATGVSEPPAPQPPGSGKLTEDSK